MEIKIKRQKINNLLQIDISALYNNDFKFRMEKRGINIDSIIELLNRAPNLKDGPISYTFDENIGYTNIVPYDHTNGVYIAFRKTSKNFSIVTNSEPQPTNILTVDIEVVNSYTVILRNVYYGTPVPLEILDDKLEVRNMSESLQFWSENAFALTDEFEDHIFILSNAKHGLVKLLTTKQDLSKRIKKPEKATGVLTPILINQLQNYYRRQK